MGWRATGAEHGHVGGRYRLLERLGTGGMSVVWRGHDEILGRPVAIKMLSAHLAAEPSSRTRLRQEALAAARLCHPHITGVFDFGEHHQVPYVVMELNDGEPVSARLRRDGPFPWREAVTIAAEVASALATAHARGIVHRDVTPANVMLTGAGAKVVDFGISALTGQRDAAPDGSLLGTPAYLAPERLAGGPVAPAADVYALGLLLYRLLTGRLPWPAGSTTEALRAHLYADPEPVPELPGMPAEVADLCLRCLAKQPEGRPRADEVATALAALVGLQPIIPPVAAGGEVAALAGFRPSPHPGLRPSRRRFLRLRPRRAASSRRLLWLRPGPGVSARPSPWLRGDSGVSVRRSLWLRPDPGAPARRFSWLRTVPGPSPRRLLRLRTGLLLARVLRVGGPEPLGGGLFRGGVLARRLLTGGFFWGGFLRFLARDRRAGGFFGGVSARDLFAGGRLDKAVLAARHRVQAAVATLVLVAAVGLVWSSTREPEEVTTAQAAAAGTGPGSVVPHGSGCKVRYQVQRDTGTDFGAQLTVVNTGEHVLAGWRLEFTFTGGQRLTDAPKRLAQRGRKIVLRPRSGTKLRPGRSVTVTLTGSYRATNPLPLTFALNGHPCQAEVLGAVTSPPPSPSTSSSPASTPSSPGPAATRKKERSKPSPQASTDKVKGGFSVDI